MDTLSRVIKLNWLPLPGICLFLGGLLWVVSLSQVAFYTTNAPVMGYWVLVTGWLGFSIFQFAWYANLLQLLAVLLMYRAPVRATLLTLLALVLAGQGFWFDVIPGQDVDVAVVRLGAGFWLWYAGMVLATLGVIFDAGNGKS